MGEEGMMNQVEVVGAETGIAAVVAAVVGVVGTDE